MSIKILLAEDHVIVREGLRALLSKEADMEVVAEAGTGEAAVQLASEQLPDVVVMDISMPGMNGIEATRLIVGAGRGIRVLALYKRSTRRPPIKYDFPRDVENLRKRQQEREDLEHRICQHSQPSNEIPRRYFHR